MMVLLVVVKIIATTALFTAAAAGDSTTTTTTTTPRRGTENPVEIIILTDRIEPTTALLDSVCVNTEKFLAFHVVVPDRREEVVWSILPESCEGSTLRIYTESGIVASWDHGAKHNSVFNCLRFYLALLPEFAHLDRIIFMDDDIVMRGDVGKLWDYPQTKAISAGCLNWIWNDCGRMEASLNFSYVQVPYFGFGSMTGARADVSNATCRSLEDEECAPPGFFDTLAEASAEIREDKAVLTLEELRTKRAWNFGLNKFNLTAWRDANLTEVYFRWINANAHYGWFPTSSLAYGLGIPFLALADDMVCMDDDDLPVLHGLGFVEADDLSRSKEVANRGIETYYALHWNGDRKPWSWEVAIDEYAEYFLAHAPKMKSEYEKKRKEVQAAAEIRKKAKTNAFFVWTAPRSGSEWFMSILDRHENVCASGETQSSGRGWPREALLLREATEWADVCQPKAVCHWSITARLLESLLQETERGQHLPESCYATQAEAANYSYYGSHLGTICALLNRAIVVAAAEAGAENAPAGSEAPVFWHQKVMQAAFHYFVAHVVGAERPGDARDNIFSEEEEQQQHQELAAPNGILNPDDRLVHASFSQDNIQMPCSCPLHTTVSGLKVMGGWLRKPSSSPAAAAGGYNLTGVISELGAKLVILDRMNLVSSYISLRIGQTLGSFHCTKGGKCNRDLRVNVQVDRLVQFLKQTIAQRVARNALLASMDVEVLHVEYESCVASPRDCFRRVLDFLDVDSGEAVLDSLLATTGGSITRDSRSLRDKVHNFDAVATGLNKAGFGHFLNPRTGNGGIITKKSSSSSSSSSEKETLSEEKKKKKTHVALLSDRAFAIAATLTSVCLHASDVEALVFHLVLPDDESDPAWDLKEVLGACEGATFELRSMASVQSELELVWQVSSEADESGTTYAKDRDPKHASPFNLARFYLPTLEAFAHADRLILLDDDVLVQGDIIAAVHETSRAPVVASCQNWFVEEDGGMASSVLMNVLETSYLGFDGIPRGAPYSKAFCDDEKKENCMPHDFLAKLAAAKTKVDCETFFACSNAFTATDVGTRLQLEPAWNWGLVSIDVPKWRAANLTRAYHAWLDAAASIFPVGSLAHGLGLGIVALAGKVQCWESALTADISVLSGLGFVQPSTLRDLGIEVESAFALHFNGDTKPWTDESPFKELWDVYASASYLDTNAISDEETSDSSFVRNRKLIASHYPKKEARRSKKEYGKDYEYAYSKNNNKYGKKDEYAYSNGGDLYVKNLWVKNLYVQNQQTTPRPAVGRTEAPTPYNPYLPAPTEYVTVGEPAPVNSPTYLPDALSAYEKKQIKKMIKKQIKKEEEEEMLKAYKQHLKNAKDDDRYYYHHHKSRF
ncbi:hypothetical protein CTAYLR_003801 [Chrysophaeum taylorii]|uniref:Uncharacterized protein n=1 Tax=Chrysophaeum taylorii TaxID=2483200 RepID=A0AAD7UF36_9STRA|nr:hypothetical protein CTAYLR_003801 [Chrysophaeum taylorii]